MSQPLTEAELALLSDASLMPSKFRIWEKLEAYLQALAKALEPTLSEASIPFEAILTSTPKVSRGENYRQNPYRVLDFPRAFDGKDIFTYRTMVLWGSSIGFHLIMAGRYRTHFLPALQEALPQQEGLFLSRQDTPWIWEPEATHLYPTLELAASHYQELLQKTSFVKLSWFLPLSDFERIPERGAHYWKQVQGWLSSQETGPSEKE